MAAVLTSDSPIALEKLDDHLKALLKVKLREFVHLSPCFADIPSIDLNRYSTGTSNQLIPVYTPSVDEDDCPNRQHRTWQRRRIRHHAV